MATYIIEDVGGKARARYYKFISGSIYGSIIKKNRILHRLKSKQPLFF